MSHMIFLVVLVMAATTQAPVARATQALEPATMLLQGSSSATQSSRYDMGAVVDVRQPSASGITVLAVTPGAAADRIGLRAGDRLLVVNGHRLDEIEKPSTTLDSALQDGRGSLRVEITREGKGLLLSGRADLVRANGAGSCGYITDQAGPTPRNDDIFGAEITQLEGRSTPITPRNRHRVDTGKRVLVVRDLIPESRLNSSQLAQIAKMKRFSFARAYKTLVVDVKPDTSYRVGARLLRDKLDTQSIRNNAYWEPVVWAEVPETCP